MPAENKEAFSTANKTSLLSLSTKGGKPELAPKTAVFTVDYHFRGFGAFVKDALLRSLNACSVSRSHAEQDNEPTYTPPKQPASYYYSTRYMLAALRGEPRHTGHQTYAYLSFWPQSSSWELCSQ